MREYIIATDSTADLPAEEFERLGIEVVPMEFLVDGTPYKHYADARKMSLDVFYEKIKAGAKVGTAQINGYTYETAFTPILEQGKDIYAVPGRVTDSLSMGCNNLIRQGAGIINSVEDFVKDLELYTCIDTTQENFNKLLLEKDESLVYACLSLRPKSMEELLKKTGFAMPQMADILQRLIQKDFITESFKNYYIRKI